MHQLQSLALDLFDHHTQDLLLSLFVFREKNKSCTILSLFGHGNTLKKNKLMGNLYHDTSTVACLVSCLSATMLHVFQHFKGIVHQLMTLTTVDIYHHTHTTSIVLVVRLIKPVLCPQCPLCALWLLKFAMCHIILTFTYILFKNRCKGISFCNYSQMIANFSYVKICPF